MAEVVSKLQIYLASSWRNPHQEDVLKALREAGHNVYDFKEGGGFGWSQIDKDYKDWSVGAYLGALTHPIADRGYGRDFKALANCDVCVYLSPCGVSAALEAGWVCGTGKPVIGYFPDMREPELMVKMFTLLTDDLDEVLKILAELADTKGQVHTPYEESM